MTTGVFVGGAKSAGRAGEPANPCSDGDAVRHRPHWGAGGGDTCTSSRLDRSTGNDSWVTDAWGTQRTQLASPMDLSYHQAARDGPNLPFGLPLPLSKRHDIQLYCSKGEGGELGGVGVGGGAPRAVDGTSPLPASSG